MPLVDADLNNAVLATPTAPAARGPNLGGAVNEDLRDAIVLRGYLERAGLQTVATATGGGVPAGVTIWRLFLSAGRDVYLDFMAQDAIRVAPYTPNNPADGLSGAPTTYPPGPIGAVTLWLTTLPTVPVVVPASSNEPTTVTAVPTSRRYFISRLLQAPTGFVSGALLDDIMDSQEARVQPWPEQDYGQGWPRSSRTNPC
jgi:hypothetical protein